MLTSSTSIHCIITPVGVTLTTRMSMLRGCSLYREKKKEIMIYGTFFLHSISSHDDLINMTVRSPELLEGIDFAFPFLSLWRLWKAQFHVLIQTNCVQFSA